ncbi:hypothetical protein F5984_02420 [Rudanella paleaurantiibacter]|uniref:Cyclic nucleotide-binding domain-containing protein n=1 Tax=Rudanella paleaurantiibacter TaxID=2614655 RepID=A0A7J5U4Q7_9BACT|nr:Crp/Fnr family transcriptional regulator [Rudanella paleaurantiibacter]KAB7732824.1 hypothetical protein F5984_02420 [Rudanella paleaurantiibacter]
MDELIHLIGRLHPVSDEFLQALTAQLKRIDLPKRSLLLSPGEVSSELYFLEAGLVRGYYLSDGKEFSTGFMAEGSFIISPLSFFTQTPSYEYLELLEEAGYGRSVKVN